MKAKGKNSDFQEKESLKKYLQGKMSPEEAYRFEKRLQQDPFLQDALEGMESLEDGLIDNDLSELSNSIKSRAGIQKRTIFYFYRIAAAITLLAVFSYIIYMTASGIRSVSTTKVFTQKLEESNKGLSDEKSASEREKGLSSEKVLSERDKGSLEKEQANARKDKSVAEAEIKKTGPETVEIEINGDENALASRAPMPEEEASDKEIAQDESITVKPDVTEKEVKKTLIEQKRQAELTATDEDLNVALDYGETREQEDTTPKAVAFRAKTVNETAPMAYDSKEKTRNDKRKARPESKVAAREMAAEAPVLPPEEALHPEPVMGFESYNNYIINNLQYPATAKEDHVEGQVEIGFIINNDSIPSQFKIVRSLTNDCDQEAIRLVREGPKWKPVYVDGQLRETEVYYTIYFRLKN